MRSDDGPGENVERGGKETWPSSLLVYLGNAIERLRKIIWEDLNRMEFRNLEHWECIYDKCTDVNRRYAIRFGVSAWWHMGWGSHLLYSSPHIVKSRNSSACTALGYGLDNRGSRVRFQVGTGNLSLHHRVQNGSGAQPASYPMGIRDSFLGGKAVGAWSWPLTSI
jgi:hypothetical protein